MKISIKKANRVIKSLLYFSLIITTISCNQRKFDNSELNKYFETSNIIITLKDGIYEITIPDSKLVEKKKETMGSKWISAEPLASVAAALALNSLNQGGDKSIDSIAIDIKIDGKFERYYYSYQQVEQVKADFNTCKEFGKIENKRNFENVSPFLGKTILETATENEIQEFFSQIFLDEKISKTELLAFKVAKNMVTLYINYYYKSGPQTYAVTFSLNGDGKIEGITLPK